MKTAKTFLTLLLLSSILAGLVGCSGADPLNSGIGTPGIGSPGTKPYITSVNPNTGSVGTQVTVSGQGFTDGPLSNGAYVTINGVRATIISWTNTAIVITVPNGATTGELIVHILSEGTNELRSNGVTFTVI